MKIFATKETVSARRLLENKPFIGNTTLLRPTPNIWFVI
jgi:hypothetical protein